MLNLFYNFILRLPENPLKKTLRDVFYGDILSERIFEYAMAIYNIDKDPAIKVKIMDVGCYYSNLPLQLASMGYKVTAIDLQDYQLTHPNLEFIKGDITKNNFVKNYDYVTCISTLEHIGLSVYDDNQDKSADKIAFSNMGKALKKGGYLLLSVPYGVLSKSETYRSYDEKSIKILSRGFRLQDVKYYKRVRGKWLTVGGKQAALINNSKRVMGVAFFKFKKI